MSNADLIQNFNALCDKCNRAIAKANEEISKRCMLEIEVAGLREELMNVYRELSEIRSTLS